MICLVFSEIYADMFGFLASVSKWSGIHTVHDHIYLGNLSELQLFWIHTTSIFCFHQMDFANIVITTNATVHKKPIGTELVVFSAFFLALFSLQLFSLDDDKQTLIRFHLLPLQQILGENWDILVFFCKCRTICPKIKKNREKKKHFRVFFLGNNNEVNS